MQKAMDSTQRHNLAAALFANILDETKNGKNVAAVNEEGVEEEELGKPVVDLGKHILRLKNPRDNSEPFSESFSYDGFDLEFNYIEKLSEDATSYGDYDAAIKPNNRIKNRYSNVLPIESSRVVLANPSPAPPGAATTPANSSAPDFDYINANWIDGLIPGSEKSYISTQGPLQETVSDFWRMVWQTNSNVIVMLTREVENDILKCSKYWPNEERNSFTFENIKITLEEEAKTFNERIVHRRFKLEDRNGNTREVMQFQYMDWRDHGLPESAEAFREVMHNVDRVRKPSTPIIVHCSAGIGRTGTFCAVHSMVEKLSKEMRERPDQTPEFNLLDTILKLRAQRVGMVQTKEQYVFCYKALLEETQKLKIPSQTPVDPHII